VILGDVNVTPERAPRAEAEDEPVFSAVELAWMDGSIHEEEVQHDRDMHQRMLEVTSRYAAPEPAALIEAVRVDDARAWPAPVPVSTGKVKRKRPSAQRAGQKMQSRAAVALAPDVLWFDNDQCCAFDDVEQFSSIPAVVTLEDCILRGSDLVSASRAASTKNTYIGYWCVFVHFLTTMGCNEIVTGDYRVGLPVSTASVVAWVGFLSWMYAPSTIDIFLAAINLMHEFHEAQSPTSSPRVRKAVEGATRLWSTVGKVKWILLPKHVRAVMGISQVCSGDKCQARRWSDVRLQRAKMALALGYAAFLRKSEILAMDVCDLELISHSPGSDEGYDVVVRKAKNDPAGRGRSACVGNQFDDGSGFRELLEEWLHGLERLNAGPCTKLARPKEHCVGCGWLFPRIGGTPPKLVVDKRVRVKTTTNFLSDDLRQVLLQLQVDCHPDVAGTPSVKAFTPVCIRRAANSIAAAEHVNKAIRQVQGRWNGPETHDQNYMFVHRSQFTGIGSLLFNSEVGDS